MCATGLVMWMVGAAASSAAVYDRVSTRSGTVHTLFTDDATTLIHHTSRGYPRAINNLAVQALVAAFATNKTIVDETSARAAITEVTTE